MSDAGVKIADLPEAGALAFSNPVVAVQGPDDALVTVQTTVGEVAEKAVEKVTVTGFGELGDTRSYAAKLADMPYSDDYKGLTQEERLAAVSSDALRCVVKILLSGDVDRAVVDRIASVHPEIATLIATGQP